MERNVTVRDIERRLAELRDAQTDPGQPPRLRTSVMTHIAWVPERWVEAATGTLAGLQERHPSRTILLFPRPEEERDELDGEVDLRCYLRGGQKGHVCGEVIALELCGSRAAAPASVVLPLLVPDLPVFLRWRGEPDFGSVELDQLADVADRLIIDSSEWAHPESGNERLPELFDGLAVSDIAWARGQPWRAAVAALWPDVAEAETMRVAGPRSDALLLAHWLGVRLRREVELQHEAAGEIELVEVDRLAARPARFEPKTASDLLSDQLDLFARDRVYEETVRSFSPVRT